jgi:hypothetical protein
VSIAAPLPCSGSVHLSVLVTEVDRLVALLRATVAVADPAAIAARRVTEDAATAEASLRLDGGLRATEDGRTERPGTWLDALGGTASGGAASGGALDDAALARLAELERAGVAAGVAADDLAAAFSRASADAGGLGAALVLLHGRITAGLVAEERVGRLRRGARVVHDASVGRVLFFPTDADLLPDAWDGLLRHVTGSGAGASAARLPSAVRAGLLHLELVRHQPFDAANGRLARAAGRLALLADDLLPAGLGAPDVVLADDPLGYHEEVGASLRRRDATHWVERALEAHGIALRRAIDALSAAVAPAADAPAPGVGVGVGVGFGVGPRSTVEPPPDALAADFTLGDVGALLGGGSDEARARCSTWVVEGLAERVVGSAGLRLRRLPAAPR